MEIPKHTKQYKFILVMVILNNLLLFFVGGLFYLLLVQIIKDTDNFWTWLSLGATTVAFINLVEVYHHFVEEWDRADFIESQPALKYKQYKLEVLEKHLLAPEESTNYANFEEYLRLKKELDEISL